MVESSAREKQEGALFLPPGFRFHPTDEEVITSYLLHKFFNPAFASRAVGDVDLNKCEPWDLPSKAKMGEKEWYFFCQKDMKYPTGMRANRATKEGYWKATGKDKEIFDKGGALVGMKKTLVFYMGRAPRGSNTSWVMHEFRLEGKSKDSTNLRANPKDEWVVCKVFHKKGAVRKAMDTGIAGATSIDGGGCGDDDFVDSVIDPTYYSPINFPNTSHGAPSAVAGSGGTSTSFFLPSYSFDTSNNQVVSNPIPSSTATVHGSSSWNMPMLPGPAHGMGSYLYQQDHTAMANALGGVIHPNFGFSKGLPLSSVAGVPPQNPVAMPQQKLGSFGSPYAS